MGTWKNLDTQYMNAVEELAFTASTAEYTAAIESLLKGYADDTLRRLTHDVSPRLREQITAHMIAQELSR